MRLPLNFPNNLRQRTRGKRRRFCLLCAGWGGWVQGVVCLTAPSVAARWSLPRCFLEDILVCARHGDVVFGQGGFPHSGRRRKAPSSSAVRATALQRSLRRGRPWAPLLAGRDAAARGGGSTTGHRVRYGPFILRYCGGEEEKPVNPRPKG